MKIKHKRILLSLMLIFITTSVIAQEEEKTSKFFVSLKAGKRFCYGLNAEDTEIAKFSGITPIINLGNGIETELSLGYTLNKILGIEMGLSYFFNDKDFNMFTYNNSKVTGRKESFNSNIIQVKPRIVLNKEFKKINFFIKTGLNIGAQTNISGEGTSETYGSTSKYIFKSNGSKIPLGYHFALGIEYKLKNNFILFSELSINKLKIENISYDYTGTGFIINVENDFYNQSYDYVPFIEESGSHIIINNYGFDIGVKYNL